MIASISGPLTQRFVAAAIGFVAFFVAQGAAGLFALTVPTCGAVFFAAFFVLYALWRHLLSRHWRHGPPIG